MTESSEASATLARNTIIYMVGNASGKVLQMLLLPLITAVLMTDEYGYYDLVITSISLVTPIATLQLTESMFRLLFEGSEIERNKTLSTVFVFMVGSALILLMAVVLARILFVSILYPLLIYLVYIGSMSFTYLQKVARTQQKNLDVAISGIVYVVGMVTVQALALLVFDLRTEGMLIGLFAAYAFASIYLEIKVCVRKKISLKFFDKKRLKELVLLSLPLVPNSVCWWFVSACNKYIISGFISIAANGIFAIANNFAQLITFVTSVFQMAWQESSIMESSSERRSAFYSSTFNSYAKLLLCGAVLILPMVRLLLPVLVDESYREAYLYVPLLIMSAVFSAFSQFYGSAYLTFKKTGGALTSSLLAAVINCLSTIILIPLMGLYAPAVGTLLAFLAQWLFRMRQTREYFSIAIDTKPLAVSAVAYGISMLVYYSGGFICQIAVFTFGLVVFFIMNKQLLGQIVRKIKK